LSKRLKLPAGVTVRKDGPLRLVIARAAAPRLDWKTQIEPHLVRVFGADRAGVVRYDDGLTGDIVFERKA